jgi:LysM repeat protein
VIGYSGTANNSPHLHLNFFTDNTTASNTDDTLGIMGLGRGEKWIDFVPGVPPIIPPFIPPIIFPTLSVSVSANKTSGTTSDKYNFSATTNVAASRVTLQFNGNSTVYQMSSSDKKNWSLNGNTLSAGNRTITITAYDANGRTATKTLNVTVTNTPVPSPALSVAVSASRTSGTTNDKYNFSATTNVAASKVTLQFNGNSTVYQMTSSDKRNWSLNGNTLSAGSRTITITAYDSSGRTATKTLNVTVTNPGTQRTHVVVTGDTLSGIGAKYGVKWQNIATANNITAPSYTIYPGQKLVIPAA